MAMGPLARYLIHQKWKILFTTQGIVTCMIMYQRFQHEINPNKPQLASFPPQKSSSSGASSSKVL
jgi:hypothetical protein